MNEQLNRIKNKLRQLKEDDRFYKIFGSQQHRYKLNPTLSSGKIREFELKYNITLPAGYASFLLNIGNGGAGPYYGIEPLENVLFTDLDYKPSELLLNPSKPFLHTKPWNLHFEATVDETNDEEYYKQLDAFQKIYFDEEQRNGCIAICNYGCAINFMLVVNGQEYGNIWVNDRANDNGIYPSKHPENEEKISFLDWYELWLDKSEEQVGRDESKKESIDKKPWWKIW